MAWTLRGPPGDENFPNVLALLERSVRVANAHCVHNHGSAYRMPAEQGQPLSSVRMGLARRLHGFVGGGYR